MPSTLLPDRAIVAITGDDAEDLLNRLVTNSVLAMAPGDARYAALLSPQGKLLFDFLVCRRAEGFALDVPTVQADELARKLTMFKLRAKVGIVVEENVALSATWDAAPSPARGEIYRDPRHPDLGHREIGATRSAAALAGHDAYDAHRIALGIPRGGVDWAYGDSFVHDANLDLLHGVDFAKGCYVGQEVVSRVHHRNSARKRIIRLECYGAPPPPGTALTAGGTVLGTVTSVAGEIALASARIDRLAEAQDSKVPVTAGETLVGVRLPSAGA